MEKMPKIFDTLDSKKVKDIKVLSEFVSIFCREKHRLENKDPFLVKDKRLSRTFDSKNLLLCEDCRKLLSHGIAKLLLCPYNPKPMCKKCETHCYAPGYREQVQEVMKFSGMYMIKHGRLNLMLLYML